MAWNKRILWEEKRVNDLSNIESRIATLKSKINAAQLAKVRAEATKENAEINYALAMQELRSKFGVDNPQDARAKLVELQKTLEAKMAEAEEISNRINL